MRHYPLSTSQLPAAGLVLAFLAAALALRLVSIFATGFCDDEAYVVAISRAPALSYFDHPPLHQWVLTAWTAAFGEGRAARLPFLGFSLLTSFALFGLTRRLFDRSAAWWTVFAFNASAYFLVYPDGYIMPDPPLLAFCALGAWAVAEILYGPPGRETVLWLAAGLALGLAGLAKYSAIFVPLGLAGFFLTTARGRRWLADPRPYAAAALGVACLAPALIWNAERHWISFAFQSGRAARSFAFNGKALGEILAAVGAQVASMTPWIGLPLAAGVIRGFPQGRRFAGTLPVVAGAAAARPVHADALARPAADLALVQFRLAVRLSARRALARRAQPAFPGPILWSCRRPRRRRRSPLYLAAVCSAP